MKKVCFGGRFITHPHKYCMLTREICPCCKVKLVAINYYKYGKTYYRNKCCQCYKKKRKPAPAAWVRSGYKKKDKCERCSFKFKLFEQSSVFHVDGNNENVDWSNLKTVCANCDIERRQSNSQWVKSKLSPDY